MVFGNPAIDPKNRHQLAEALYGEEIHRVKALPYKSLFLFLGMCGLWVLLLLSLA
jgi:hypothetical protein